MANPQQPTAADESVGTALQLSRDEMKGLTPEDRAEIVRRKAANIVTAQVAGINWGKGIDKETQRAVADWSLRHGIDANTEIHVLGGNIYLNAQFYLNRLVELVRAGRVLDFRQFFINHDPRLDVSAREVAPAGASPATIAEVQQSAEDATREIRRRRQLRILHNVPDSATSAVLTEVVLTALPHTPFCGVKWAPRNDSDPIGTKFPQETALTRSARRALKLCVRHLPEVHRYVDNAEDDAVATIETARQEQRDARQLGTGSPAEPVVRRPSGTVEEAAAASRAIPAPDYLTATPAARLTPEQLERAARGSDPYGVSIDRLGDAPAPATAPAATPAEPVAADPGDDVADLDDLDLLTPEERREHDERKRLGRA